LREKLFKAIMIGTQINTIIDVIFQVLNIKKGYPTQKSEVSIKCVKELFLKT